MSAEAPAAPVTDLRAPAPGGSIRHIDVVDGLRGIAVLLVVVFHFYLMTFWPIPLPFSIAGSDNLEFVQFAGDLGVELFFFLSAFCLFHPHAKAMFGVGPVPGLRHFYYRRAIKIVPSYVLAVVVGALFLRDIAPSTYEHGILADLGLHAVFLHNVSFETMPSFNLVLWSLAVEVQFYYLFPAMAKCVRRFPFLSLAGFALVALLFRRWVREEHSDNFPFWNNQLPAYLDVFAFGMLAAYLVVRIQHRPAVVARMRWAFTAIGITAFVLMLALFRWRFDIRYEGPLELWKSQQRFSVAAVFACILIGSVFALGWWRKVLANPVTLFLSTISYNLYLWHVMVGRVIKDHGWYGPSTDPPWADKHWAWTFTLLGIAASIAFAALVTYAFERPLLRHGVRGVLRRLRRSGRPVRSEDRVPLAADHHDAPKVGHHTQ